MNANVYANVTWNTFTGNDQRKTNILLPIVVVFVVCQSFTIVADVYEAVSCTEQNKTQSLCLSNTHIENIIDIAHFMLSFNSSINFLLYVIHDRTFRETFVKVSIRLDGTKQGCICDLLKYIFPLRVLELCNM